VIIVPHFANGGFEKDRIVRLWNDCADRLKVSPDRLRPTDRFDHEMRARDFWASLDDPKDNLARHVISRAKQLGTTIELDDVTTVAELVLRLAAIEQTPHSSKTD
jgi:hypothetical protein